MNLYKKLFAKVSSSKYVLTVTHTRYLVLPLESVILVIESEPFPRCLPAIIESSII